MSYIVSFFVMIFIFYLIRLLTYKNNFEKVEPKLKVSNYHIIYADKKMENENIITGKILKSEKYNIVGKPDYILKHNRKEIYIPIELKSGSVGNKEFPNGNDLIQLSAYFIIIEEHFGGKIKEGRLIYSDYMFIVKNTKAVRKNVVETLENMRDMLESGEGEVEPSFVKCRHCRCKGTVCEFCEE